jgi:hypothetical protein
VLFVRRMVVNLSFHFDLPRAALEQKAIVALLLGLRCLFAVCARRRQICGRLILPFRSPRIELYPREISIHTYPPYIVVYPRTI